MGPSLCSSKLTRGLRAGRRRRDGVRFELGDLDSGAEGLGLRDGPGDGDLAVGRGVEGLLVAADERAQAGVGQIAEGHLRVQRIVAGELHAAGAADVGVRDVGGQVEDDFLAAGLGGRGEVAERLVVE